MKKQGLTLKALEEAYKQAVKYQNSEAYFWANSGNCWKRYRQPNLLQRIKIAIKYILNK